MSRYLLQRAMSHPALPISRKAARNASRAVPVRLSSDEESFYERLGEDADVRLEPGINQDEFFDEQFERRAHEIQRTPSANNAVNVISAKNGPWTGNNNLGIERAFSPDANNRQTVLKLPEWGFPEMWTLCLGMNDYSTAGGLEGFSVTAEIEFGCGGVIQVVEIDWLQGMCISLPMNALNLVASYRTGSGEGATIIPDDLRLRASVVRGRSHRAHPTRTVYFEEGESTIEIPKFSQSVMILPSVGAPVNTPFAFYGAGFYVDLMTTPTGGPGDQRYNVSQLVEYVDVINQLVGNPRSIPIQPFQRLLQMQDSLGAASALTNAQSAIFEIAI